MIELPRRRFLSCLVGLVAAPAVVKADSLMRVFVPKPDNSFEAYTSWFKQMGNIVQDDWRYNVRTANIDRILGSATTYFDGLTEKRFYDVAVPEPLLPQQSTERGIAAGQLRL